MPVDILNWLYFNRTVVIVQQCIQVLIVVYLNTVRATTFGT